MGNVSELPALDIILKAIFVFKMDKNFLVAELMFKSSLSYACIYFGDRFSSGVSGYVSKVIHVHGGVGDRFSFSLVIS